VEWALLIFEGRYGGGSPVRQKLNECTRGRSESGEERRREEKREGGREGLQQIVNIGTGLWGIVRLFNDGVPATEDVGRELGAVEINDGCQARVGGGVEGSGKAAKVECGRLVDRRKWFEFEIRIIVAVDDVDVDVVVGGVVVVVVVVADVAIVRHCEL